MIIGEDVIETLSNVVDPLLEKQMTPTNKQTTSERVQPVLYPPGTIVHFYRSDGVGVSGSIVPCTFFDRIHLRRRMIEDHLFHSGYEMVFLDFMRHHLRDHTFQFENPVTPCTDTDKTDVHDRKRN